MGTAGGILCDVCDQVPPLRPWLPCQSGRHVVDSDQSLLERRGQYGGRLMVGSRPLSGVDNRTPGDRARRHGGPVQFIRPEQAGAVNDGERRWVMVAQPTGQEDVHRIGPEPPQPQYLQGGPPAEWGGPAVPR
jgi:hypothetical protein